MHNLIILFYIDFFIRKYDINILFSIFLNNNNINQYERLCYVKEAELYVKTNI